MGQDKEEYEVGIPLDDLSASAEPLETDPAETKNDDAAARPEDDEGVGLPSLFDEDELAEVGLKAAPFEDDGDFMVEAPDPPEGGPDTEEGLFPDEPPEPIASDVTPGDGLEEPASIGELNPTVDDGEPVQEDRETPDFQEQESLEEKVGPLIGETETPPTLQHEIGTIHSLLTELKEEFVGKLKYDAHKDKIIDKLHQELQEYKQDIVKKHILSIVLDVVKVADDIRKWLTYFRSLDVSQRDPVKLFRYLEAIPSDLEDIFYWQGVRPYTNKGGIFNPAKQRAIKKIPTDDRSRDKTIAKSLRPGYEWEDKVIRQEMVAVYVYEDEIESVDTRNIDE